MGGVSVSSSRKYDWDNDAPVTRKSAKQYSGDDGRVYTGYASKGLKPPVPPVGMDITTDAFLPEIILLDVTGSMKSMPRLFLEKLATLYEESNAVLHGYGPDEMKTKAGQVADDLALSIIAVGDAHCDSHPLQVANFERRAGLINPINNIYPEGGGGGQAKESYELALYYVMKHCKLPNLPQGAKPLLVVFGDEAFYDEVDKTYVKRLIGDDLKADIPTKDVIKELQKQYEIFVLRPELDYDADTYKMIHRTWESVLGPERVLKMQQPERVVDDIVGLNGIISYNFKKAEDVLRRRQTPKQVDDVLKDLHPAASAAAAAAKPKAKMKRAASKTKES